jgi:hypothetical protein
VCEIEISFSSRIFRHWFPWTITGNNPAKRHKVSVTNVKRKSQGDDSDDEDKMKTIGHSSNSTGYQAAFSWQHYHFAVKPVRE